MTHPVILTVLAPVTGTVRGLDDVPDPVFAQRMVGPGVALEPPTRSDGSDVLDTDAPDAPARVVAPVTGVVVALRPHALVIRADGAVARDVLVHLGVDTVGLAGGGFDVLVVEGARVLAGETVLTWDPVAVVAAGLSAMCPVVALQADPALLRLRVVPGQVVAHGAPLFDWA